MAASKLTPVGPLQAGTHTTPHTGTDRSRQLLQKLLAKLAATQKSTRSPTHPPHHPCTIDPTNLQAVLLFELQVAARVVHVVVRVEHIVQLPAPVELLVDNK